ncbi:hypothetical protein HJG60_008417 [Phyllostomus discolor]|uniref:Uncharacterized protein n=1 Tax=Phyllostomus discolor TaxID=89673 RepID=A0A833Z467_9CHIR|nr:hypothetical protein HJG60_008417 [Phyllostomus discolor]
MPHKVGQLLPRTAASLGWQRQGKTRARGPRTNRQAEWTTTGRERTRLPPARKADNPSEWSRALWAPSSSPPEASPRCPVQRGRQAIGARRPVTGTDSRPTNAASHRCWAARWPGVMNVSR